MASCIDFEGVSLLRQGRTVLDQLDWRVEAGQRWVILGPNGSGKTTIVGMAGTQIHPSMGTVTVLGARLGRVDVRELRKRIGIVSGSVSRVVDPALSVFDVVASGIDSVLRPRWDTYARGDLDRARDMLSELGLVSIADRSFEVISEGERQRTLLARALMAKPSLLLLDEPFAGLDLGARENLMRRLADVFVASEVPGVVLVTHHLEEIPSGTTHVALLKEGAFVGQGYIGDTLTSGTVSRTFDVDVAVANHGDRWTCRYGAAGT